jgi:hypothetical protein
LVTDVGYRQQQQVVWERLDDTGGDTDYCDATFRTAAPISSEDPDHLLALQLARDDEAARERALPTVEATEVAAAPAGAAPAGAAPAAADDADYQAALALQYASSDGAPRADADTDAALARQLQAEENAAARSRPPAAAGAQARRVPPPATAARRRPPKKPSGCIVA